MAEPTLHLVREAEARLADRALRRARARGELIRVRPGVMVSLEEWNAADADGRYRAKVRAAASTSRRPAQTSHDSAAALWRLPSLGPWPAEVHETTGPDAPAGARIGVVRHRTGFDPSSVEIDGVTVTSLMRTLTDVARTSAFERSVVMFDAAVRERPVLLRQLRAEPVGLGPGAARLRAVLAFTDPLSESVGESFCRAQFRSLGYPPPVLQHPIVDAGELLGRVDFYWPELDLAVEFDGRVKYGSARRFEPELAPEDVLWNEKRREDRIRRVVTRFDRLTWDVAHDRRVLAARLARHGLTARRASVRFSDENWAGERGSGPKT